MLSNSAKYISLSIFAPMNFLHRNQYVSVLNYPSSYAFLIAHPTDLSTHATGN
jgi:hypothetical protein